MVRYDFAEVSLTDNDNEIYVSCTYPTTVENVIALLKSAPVKLNSVIRQTHSNETWNWLLKELPSGKKLDILWWTIKQFLENGWEPLGAYSLSSKIIRYQFRRTR